MEENEAERDWEQDIANKAYMGDSWAGEEHRRQTEHPEQEVILVIFLMFSAWPHSCLSVINLSFLTPPHLGSHPYHYPLSLSPGAITLILTAGSHSQGDESRDHPEVAGTKLWSN